VRILVVTATDPEIAPVVTACTAVRGTSPDPRVRRFTRGPHAIDVLTTGVGMVATAVWCARVLATGSYGLALNAGVCGSFDTSLGPGAVVHVTEDCLAELGVEDGDAFLSLQEVGLPGADDAPFRGGRLRNESPPANAALRALPAARGITVNTVHGHEPSIARARARFDPQVESMEGAAFMYASLVNGTPFAQVRAVSNMVERRNRAAWKIGEAVHNLGGTVLRILDQS
jgi:futalosine hydrolase